MKIHCNKILRAENWLICEEDITEKLLGNAFIFEKHFYSVVYKSTFRSSCTQASAWQSCMTAAPLPYSRPQVRWPQGTVGGVRYSCETRQSIVADHWTPLMHWRTYCHTDLPTDAQTHVSAHKPSGRPNDTQTHRQQIVTQTY